MTEPTDEDLDVLILQHWPAAATATLPLRWMRTAFREGLAKWGTPPALAPWRSAVLDLIDQCAGLTMEQDQWLSRRVKELDFASTPQPTQAQAGAVPLTDEQIDELHGEANRGYCIEFEHYVKAVRDTEAAHGIKET